jgi:hypothetical protein
MVQPSTAFSGVRAAHRHEQVAHVVLPPARSERRTDGADDGSRVQRPAEQRDVSERTEQMDRVPADLDLVRAAEQQNRHVRPWRLALERLREERQVGCLECLLGDENRAGSGLELTDERREAVAERAVQLRARE